MTIDPNNSAILSQFAKYLITQKDNPESIPSLTELSKQLNLSVSSLREQLEVARALGLVDVKPRLGIRKLPYKFSPAVRLSLTFGMATDISLFNNYADLRKHIEETYWYEAVTKLTEEDKSYLKVLVEKAIAKLNGTPIQIPHIEHRELHLTIYNRLYNEFVMGLLEVYWDAYESIGLNVYTDLEYLEEVWDYHKRMVEAICNEEYERGYDLLQKHTDLLYNRANKSNEGNLHLPDDRKQE
ncbi:MAG TPA: FCD domain-containing protein [Anaerolineales bacterium]|nr:FCD domain-containing protein [Anaerolineales bacterium]